MQYNIEELKKKYNVQPVAPTGSSSNTGGYDVEALKAKYVNPQPVAQQQALPKTGFIQDVKDSFNERKTNIQGIISEGLQGVRQNLPVAGQVAGFVGDVAGDAIINTGKVLLPKFAENVIASGAKKVFDSHPVQSVASTYGNVKSKFPESTRAVESVLNIASLLPGGAITKAGAVKTVDTTLSTVLPKAKAIFEPSTKALEQKVVTQFEKGVKPLLNARSTPEMVKKYKNNIVSATKVIADNKNNLSFIDDIGDVTVGKNPQTLQQLSEAVDQTKKSVFSEYNALTKQSGKKGLTVKTDNIADELDFVIADEALQISNPTAVQYAKDLKDRLSYRELSPEVTENVIKNYNESLKAFYKNPSYDNASKASIDALIVNKLRQQLDEGITNLTGEQYQVLKNKYGALKTIENDVLKATLRDARKNNKGLIDFTDIFSGGNVVAGILSMNPTMIAQGTASRGFKEYYKYLNSPNRAVKKMFNSTEKLNQRSIPKTDLTKSPNTVSESLLKTAPSTNIPTIPNNIDIPTTIPPTKSKSIPLKNNQSGMIKIGDNKESLVATHNISIEKFLKGSKQGGFANPSMAIFDSKHGFNNFGEISLLGSKDLIAKGKTFASDVYSPRYPRVEVVAQDLKPIENILKRFEKETGDYVYNLDKDNIVESLLDSPLTKASYLDSKNIEIPKVLDKDGRVNYYDTKKSIQKVIDDKQLHPDYIKYATEIVQLGGAKERIWTGSDKMGRNKYVPNTLENASKVMNKEKIRGGENFFPSLGSIRANVSKELKTFKSIKDSKDLLKTGDEFTKIREVYEKTFDDVVDSLSKYGNSTEKNSFIKNSRERDGISNYLATGNKKDLSYSFKDIPEIELQKLDDIRIELQSMPTEYFETKFKRPVKINEFSHAVIPNDTPKEVLDILKENNISFTKYKSGDDADRLKIIKQLKDNKQIDTFGKVGVNPLTVGAGVTALGAGGMYLNNKDKK